MSSQGILMNNPLEPACDRETVTRIIKALARKIKAKKITSPVYGSMDF